MTARNAAALLVASSLVNALGARALDSLGLIEGVLSPSGARILILVPVAALFFAARLCCYFVAPGLLLGALLDFARLRWLPPSAPPGFYTPPTAPLTEPIGERGRVAGRPYE
jgi:hypothetical protein